VSPAQAANCRLITVYGQEMSSVGLVQYKLKQRNYWCSDGRHVTYYAVSMSSPIRHRCASYGSGPASLRHHSYRGSSSSLAATA
jgi:hypothetical protein